MYKYLYKTFIIVFIITELLLLTSAENDLGILPTRIKNNIHHNKQNIYKSSSKIYNRQINSVNYNNNTNININNNSSSNSNNTNDYINVPKTTHPIRIVFNTTFLEQQLCSYVGQRIDLFGNATLSCDNPSVKDSTSNETSCYVLCKEQDVLTKDDLNTLLKMLTDVQFFFAQFLTFHGPLYNSYNKEPFICEENYLIDVRTPFEGDLMIYLTAHPAFGEEKGYSGYCLQHQHYVNPNGNNKQGYLIDGAPMVGYINLTPSYYNATYGKTKTGYGYHRIQRVLIHETTHILGFSNLLYPSYINRQTGLPYTKPILDRRTINETTPSGESYTIDRYYLSSPTLVEVARYHFNCSTLEELEVENTGDSANAGSHWKGSILGNEILQPTTKSDLLFTHFTLALLYDSGWYGVINEDKVDQALWGRNKGCSFVNDKCSPATWNYTGYWSEKPEDTDPSIFKCTATRSGQGYNLFKDYGKPLPPAEQHWKNASIGGNFPEYDFCNFRYPFNSCANESIPTSRLGEIYSKHSKCFVEYDPNINTQISSCRPQRCRNNQIEVQFFNVWHHCAPGTNITLSARHSIVEFNSTFVQNVTIECPDAMQHYLECDPSAQLQLNLSPFPYIPDLNFTTNTFNNISFNLILFVNFTILFIIYL